MVDVFQPENPTLLPTSRKGSCMAYDARHAVTMLFGGNGLNDTWLWDGRNWIEHHPPLAPPARTSACMAYDAARHCIVLFGGADQQGNLLDDTWTWNGSSWRQHATAAPLPRCGAGMAYDAMRQHIVLFGGQTYNGHIGKPLNDTWTWNGSFWTRHLVSQAPPARHGASIIYHALYQHVILFGGTNGSTTFNDTWAWDGTTWTPLSPSSRPPARAWASCTYHEPMQRVVLIGGHGDGSPGSPPVLNDIWLWNGISWTELPAPNTPAGGYHSAAYHAASQTIVLYATISNKPDLGDKTRGTLHTALSPLSTAASWRSETWLWKP